MTASSPESVPKKRANLHFNKLRRALRRCLFLQVSHQTRPNCLWDIFPDFGQGVGHLDFYIIHTKQFGRKTSKQSFLRAEMQNASCKYSCSAIRFIPCTIVSITWLTWLTPTRSYVSWIIHFRMGENIFYIHLYPYIFYILGFSIYLSENPKKKCA